MAEPRLRLRWLRAWSQPVLAILAVAGAVWAARDALIPLATAVVLSVLLWPAVSRLEGLLHSRVAAALLALTLFVLGAGGLGAVVSSQLSSAMDQVPTVLRQVSRDVASLGTGRAQAVQQARSALRELDRSVARVTGTVAPGIAAAPSRSESLVASAAAWFTASAIDASKSAAKALLQCGAIVMLSFFLLCGGRAGAERLRRLWPEFAAESMRQVRAFVAVTLATNLAIAAAMTLGFAAFGVPQPLLWGLAAGALHFVPYAGLALALLLATLEVYAVQGSAALALAAAGYVTVVGIVVGTAMAVWLQGRAARVGSAWLFAGTVFWSVLWGGWGLMLGPLLVVTAHVALRLAAGTRVPAVAPAVQARWPQGSAA